MICLQTIGLSLEDLFEKWIKNGGIISDLGEGGKKDRRKTFQTWTMAGNVDLYTFIKEQCVSLHEMMYTYDLMHVRLRLRVLIEA